MSSGQDDPMDVPRCRWTAGDGLLIHYHDLEWGQAPSTDAKWLEMIVLETFQAGLSWRTVLHKRENFRQAFQGFQPAVVAALDEADVDRMLMDEGIIRNRKKLLAAVANARVVTDIVARHGSVGQALADLKMDEPRLIPYLRSTFAFVGTTTAYSIAHATGWLQPPHEATCYLHAAAT